MEITRIKFERKIFSNEYTPADWVYEAHFKTKTDLLRWYDRVRAREDWTSRNFYGNPYEWASSITFSDITITPPETYHGDRNWYKYGENCGFIVKIIKNIEQDGY